MDEALLSIDGRCNEGFTVDDTVDDESDGTIGLLSDEPSTASFATLLVTTSHARSALPAAAHTDGHVQVSSQVSSHSHSVFSFSLCFYDDNFSIYKASQKCNDTHSIKR